MSLILIGAIVVSLITVAAFLFVRRGSGSGSGSKAKRTRAELVAQSNPLDAQKPPPKITSCSNEEAIEFILESPTLYGRMFLHLADVFAADDADAVEAMVSRSFKFASRKVHPDKNAQDERAVQAFQLLKKAKEVLSDAEQRDEYNLSLTPHELDEDDDEAQANAPTDGDELLDGAECLPGTVDVAPGHPSYKAIAAWMSNVNKLTTEKELLRGGSEAVERWTRSLRIPKSIFNSPEQVEDYRRYARQQAALCGTHWRSCGKHTHFRNDVTPAFLVVDPDAVRASSAKSAARGEASDSEATDANSGDNNSNGKEDEEEEKPLPQLVRRICHECNASDAHYVVPHEGDMWADIVKGSGMFASKERRYFSLDEKRVYDCTTLFLCFAERNKTLSTEFTASSHKPGGIIPWPSSGPKGKGGQLGPGRVIGSAVKTFEFVKRDRVADKEKKARRKDEKSAWKAQAAAMRKRR